jgi:hypothetical protein
VGVHLDSFKDSTGRVEDLFERPYDLAKNRAHWSSWGWVSPPPRRGRIRGTRDAAEHRDWVGVRTLSSGTPPM